MSEVEKPKSSTAEKVTSAASIASAYTLWQTFKLHAKGYEAIVKSIYGTNDLITKNQNLQSEILVKQLEVQSKLIDIDKSLKSQVVISKKIEQNQRILIESQNRQNILLQKQVLLSEEQVLIQKHSLIAQEIQAKIAVRNDAEKEKQKELKKTIFSFDLVLKEVEKQKNNLIKVLLLVQLKDDLEKNSINPNDLEEITDKQFANNIFESFENLQKIAIESLNEQERNEIDFFHKHKGFENEIKKEIENIKSKIEKNDKSIKECDKRTEWSKVSLNSYNKEIQYYENLINVNKDKKEFNSGFSLFLSFSLLTLFIVNFILIGIYKDSIVFLFYSIISLFLFTLISFLITLIKIFNNPKRKIKRYKKKIIKAHNSIKELESNLKNVISDKNNFLNELSDLKKFLIVKENELTELIVQVENFYRKYPELLDFNK